ncbi:MAG: hypothetical protein Q4D98_10750 [Planctomycetia bacterium]|nr:hypothetical protein [Planctomycetia bacterium]
MAENKRFAYFCGKKFVEDDEGRLVRVPARKGYEGGRFGDETVTIRVPKTLLPLIEHLLVSIEEIEIIRRNIETNILNTSPELLFGSDMRTKYSSDWKKAVSYALKAAREAEKKLNGGADGKGFPRDPFPSPLPAARPKEAGTNGKTVRK